MDGAQIFVMILILLGGIWFARNYVNKNEIKELSADEARELSKKNRIIAAKAEIKRINEKINKVVLLGGNILETYTYYDAEIEFYLKSMGYKVSYCDERAGARKTIIKWE